jgi:hypothetical protein
VRAARALKPARTWTHIDTRGKTTLRGAAEKGYDQVIEYLAEHG